MPPRRGGGAAVAGPVVAEVLQIGVNYGEKRVDEDPERVYQVRLANGEEKIFTGSAGVVPQDKIDAFFARDNAARQLRRQAHAANIARLKAQPAVTSSAPENEYGYLLKAIGEGRVQDVERKLAEHTNPKSHPSKTEKQLLLQTAIQCDRPAIVTVLKNCWINVPVEEIILSCADLRDMSSACFEALTEFPQFSEVFRQFFEKALARGARSTIQHALEWVRGHPKANQLDVTDLHWDALTARSSNDLPALTKVAVNAPALDCNITPLHLAALNPVTGITLALLAAGAKIDAETKLHLTNALSIAVVSPDEDTVPATQQEIENAEAVKDDVEASGGRRPKRARHNPADAAAAPADNTIPSPFVALYKRHAASGNLPDISTLIEKATSKKALLFLVRQAEFQALGSSYITNLITRAGSPDAIEAFFEHSPRATDLRLHYQYHAYDRTRVLNYLISQGDLDRFEYFVTVYDAWVNADAHKYLLHSAARSGNVQIFKQVMARPPVQQTFQSSKESRYVWRPSCETLLNEAVNHPDMFEYILSLKDTVVSMNDGTIAALLDAHQYQLIKLVFKRTKLHPNDPLVESQKEADDAAADDDEDEDDDDSDDGGGGSSSNKRKKTSKPKASPSKKSTKVDTSDELPKGQRILHKLLYFEGQPAQQNYGFPFSVFGKFPAVYRPAQRSSSKKQQNVDHKLKERAEFLQWLFNNYNDISFHVQDDENKTPLHILVEGASAVQASSNADQDQDDEDDDAGDDEDQEEDDQETEKEEEKDPVLALLKIILAKLKTKSGEAAEALQITDNDSTTPIHIAAQKGWWSGLELLLQVPGLNINLPLPAKDAKGEKRVHAGYTPLHLCLQNDYFISPHFNPLIAMIKYGADVNATDAEGVPALNKAINQSKNISFLLRHSQTNVNAVEEKTGYSFVHRLITDRENDPFIELRQYAADAHTPLQLTLADKQGQTALHLAATKGFLLTARWLVQQQAFDVNGPDHDGNSPLALAVLNSKVEWALWFLTQPSVNTNILVHILKEEDGVKISRSQGLYQYAMSTNQGAIVHSVLENPSVDRLSIVHDSLLYRKYDLALRLLQIVPNKDSSLWFSLFQAPEFDSAVSDADDSAAHLAMCKKLVEANVALPSSSRPGDPNASPLLHLVITNKRPALDEALLSWFLSPAGGNLLAQITQPDGKNRTPIHLAVQSQLPWAVELLLKSISAADREHLLNWEDDQGETPLSEAVGACATKPFGPSTSILRMINAAAKGAHWISLSKKRHHPEEIADDDARMDVDDTPSSSSSAPAPAAAVPVPDPAAAVASTTLPPCRYGKACYRTNPDHHKEFSHPPDAVGVLAIKARDASAPAPAPVPPPSPPKPTTAATTIKKPAGPKIDAKDGTSTAYKFGAFLPHTPQIEALWLDLTKDLDQATRDKMLVDMEAGRYDRAKADKLTLVKRKEKIVLRAQALKDLAKRKEQLKILREKKAAEEEKIRRTQPRRLNIPVDQSCHYQSYRVYVDKEDIYDVMLNQTDIDYGTFGHNKFYVIQLLEWVDPATEKKKKNQPMRHFNHKPDKRYRVVNRWGRVSEYGEVKHSDFGQLDAAIKAFTAKFREKTQNDWKKRDSFVKVDGKYDLVERYYELLPEDDEDDDAKKAKDTDKDKTKLSSAVYDVIHMITDVDSLNKEMKYLGLDLQRMPLGKLSQSQIDKGYRLLREIEEDIVVLEGIDALRGRRRRAEEGKEEKIREHLTELSNKFYTLIPTDVGRSLPQTIDNRKLLAKKVALLDSMESLHVMVNFVAEQMCASTAGLTREDAIQANLGTDIKELPKTSEMYQTILEYIQTTSDHLTPKIEAIFKLSRWEELDRFDKFARMRQQTVSNDRPHNMLLWHGSSVTNILGILANGLRIAPPEAPSTGHMFGKGIYLADTFVKSAGYCRGSSNGQSFLMLLCEGAIGESYKRFDAEYMDAPPVQFLSTQGVGAYGGGSNMIRTPKGVGVPVGLVRQGQSERTVLRYNEFIVYDVAQVKLKYLIRFRL